MLRTGTLFVLYLSLTLGLQNATLAADDIADKATPWVSAGRDINARDIIVNTGYSAAEVEALVKAAASKAPSEGALSEKGLKLAHELGVTTTALQNFFRILGQEQVPAEKLLDTLADIAKHHVALLKSTGAVTSDDDEIVRLHKQATAAIEQGAYAEAETALAAIGERELALARKQEAEVEGRYLAAAETQAQRGDLNLTQLRYLEAAKNFEDAAKTVPTSHWKERGNYLERQALALSTFGDQKGDNDVLRRAIATHETALQEYTRERVPLAWAGTQNNLGSALLTLGKREPGVTRLEQAVTAFQAALQESTRERVPLDWAGTQYNLGNALRSLGERESGAARLEQAVIAYQAALQERTRERVPLDWASTQNNLGNAFWALGERESGTARLEQAVTAFQAALQESTRERVPLRWARTQNNLGNALIVLAQKTRNRNLLTQAKSAIEASFSVYTESNNHAFDDAYKLELETISSLLKTMN